MLRVSLIGLMLMTGALIIHAYILAKDNKMESISPLIGPFFIYQMIILMSGVAQKGIENYYDQQIFTFSQGFFTVYAMLMWYLIKRVVDDPKYADSKNSLHTPEYGNAYLLDDAISLVKS